MYLRRLDARRPVAVRLPLGREAFGARAGPRLRHWTGQQQGLLKESTHCGDPYVDPHRSLCRSLCRFLCRFLCRLFLCTCVMPALSKLQADSCVPVVASVAKTS